MKILKVISALMNYPSQALQQHADALVAEIKQAKEIPPESRENLIALVDSTCRRDLMDVQEEYGQLFDKGSSLSLLLFEHVHGDSRERGQAMVDLMALYEANGFDIAVRELPDFIPLYLEYLAQRPDLEAREGLADVGHIFGVLAARLKEREFPHFALFEALLIISGIEINAEELKEAAATETRDDSMEAMDKIWEEEQVTFMANQQSGGDGSSSGCSVPSQNPTKAREEPAVPLHWVSNDQAIDATQNK